MVPTDRIGMSSASYGDVSLRGCTGHGGRKIIMWTAVVVVVMRRRVGEVSYNKHRYSMFIVQLN